MYIGYRNSDVLGCLSF